MGTEFGRGYATCLYQFVMHEPRLEEDEMLDFYRTRMGYSPTKGESAHVGLWANGASDHLYDLVTGGRVAQKHRSMAHTLAAEAIRCGHGFTGEMWALNQARGWIRTARFLLAIQGAPLSIEEAMEIDRGLGLRPELGVTCAELIPVFQKEK